MNAKTKYQHVRSVDLIGNGIVKEILVMNEDLSNGDIYFIAVDHLDEIDRGRILQMLRHRDAVSLPLWEVMANTTLKNGQNALLFFHQLVKVRTQAGQILPPGKGRGLPHKVAQTLTQELTTSEAQTEKRGPGRPSKQAQ